MMMSSIHGKWMILILCLVVLFIQPWILTTSASRTGHFNFVLKNLDHDHDHEVSCSSDGGCVEKSVDLMGGIHTRCFSNSSGYHCVCDEGYTGSPYSPQGCYDIDECKEPQKYPCIGICQNTPGNYTCNCPPGMLGDGKFFCQKHDDDSITTILEVTGLIIGVLIIFLLIFMLCKKRIKKIVKKSTNKWSCKSKNQKFTFSEVITITNNFQKLIGKGGFGKVYQGNLKDGTQVAVKILSSSSSQGSKEFQNEVELLVGVHHRNLVSLIGYCNEGENMAVIYEYMAKGNLKQHISTNSTENILTWKQRLQIANDAARGLEYLHNGCKPPIIHRDLKTSNILLNDKLQAKIADLGLSKIFPISGTTVSHISTDPKGTFGYLDPQYYRTRMLNKKSDIYSYGVILLELITGQPAIIEGEAGSIAIHISQWVALKIENDDVESIVDPRLRGTYQIDCAWKAIKAAMACIKLESASVQRPEISWVCNELKESLEMQMADERSSTTTDDQEIDSSSTMSSDSSDHVTSVRAS